MYLIVESKFEAKAKKTAILAKKYLVNGHKFNPTHIIAASGKGDFGETTNAKNDVKITIWVQPIGGNFNKPPYSSETIKAIGDEISDSPVTQKVKITNRTRNLN